MGDNPVSASTSPQRKLPNPASSANTNSNLKEILIKPKRILPAQPDNLKQKRSVQENTTDCKSDEGLTETIQTTPSLASGKSGNTNKEPTHKVTIPKLQIDVERLKTHFQLNSKSLARNVKRNTDLNENDLTDSESDRKAPVRTASESVNSNVSTGLDKESALYNYSSDGLTKVKEWCSAGEIGKMTAKMATDQVGKSIERSIRSPSPKSNTTWDRSSSGYSSDERADPRSPPPNHSANISVSSKTETEATTDDAVSVTNTAETSDPQDVEDSDIGLEQDTGNNDEGDFNSTLTNNTDQSLTIKSELSDSPTTSSTEKEDSSPSPPSSCTEDNEVKNNTGAKCDNCDSNQDKIDSTNSCVNLNFDNSTSAKQNVKRPTWTAHSTLPGNGRVIQYRKSGSESTISLRHSSRMGSFENNFDGLEVCGKSFPPQSANSISVKNDNSVPESDTGSRQEVATPSSAFSPVHRQLPNPDTDGESPRIVPRCLELPARAHFLRPQLTPRGLGPHAKFNLPKDDKEIRRTLHDLSSPRRHSPGGKALPIRARHPIQPMSVMDTNSNQPMAVSHSAIVGTNRFSKKMWRAPSGQPENAQSRPFSPFGGTLPAAKIKEQEKLRHSSDGNPQ